MFIKNGYPIKYFNRVLARFRLSMADSAPVTESESDRDRFKHILKIPFVGSASYDFGNKVKALFLNEFQVEVHPVYSSFKIKSYFSLKSRTPYLYCSNVVYKFTCLCDANLSYIGKTKRHLITRAAEHLDPKKDTKSEVKTHLESCRVCQGANPETDFKILKSCRSDFEARVQEAFLIKKHNPPLNKQLFNKGSLFTIKIF